MRLSYYEALEDGIPMEEGRYSTRYYPPCRVCGAPVYSWSYLRGTQYICGDCRKEMVALEMRERAASAGDKKPGKLNTAIKRISKVAAIDLYADAIAWVSEHMGRPGWFQSTEEIMVALELIRRGVKAHHQVTVQDYKVDFVLPDLKVALEIDGAIFHGKDRTRHDQIRDEVIAYQLGAGWEVVRISTDNINKNITKLVPAIRAVLADRKKRACGGRWRQ